MLVPARRLLVLVLILGVGMGLLPLAHAAGRRAASWEDSFEYADMALEEGQRLGPWTVVWDGFGQVRVDGSQLVLDPAPAVALDETHAALVVSRRGTSERFEYQVSVTTDEQLRQGDAANPWESAWVVWGYASAERFYYLALKPTGWEIGERDPAFPGGQRFIATGDDVFALDAPARVRVRGTGGRYSVWAGERLLGQFEDPTRTGGSRVGVYVEDARAVFDDVSVRELPGR